MSDDRLKSLVDRCVRLETERSAISADLKDIKQEAKSAGYDAKAFALLVRRAMEDADKRGERERIDREVALMEAALGVLAETPLGVAAKVRRVA